MSTAVRWLIAALAILLVLALLVWARGTEHQRGDDVGAFGIARTVAGSVGRHGA
ncbi:hypothetical protein [Aeromicrobium sp.]|uniref:hypothetical protein n=1 Tax=Aeromicrobium sp. TaxID=1871063 RepID=UPI003D6AAB37